MPDQNPAVFSVGNSLTSLSPTTVVLKMLSPKLRLYLFVLFSTLHVHRVLSQCTDPDFTPCPPDGSSDVGGDDSSGGGGTPTVSSGIGEGFGSPAVESAAVSTILARQAALCCAPAPVQCLILDSDVPACYNPDTTGYLFADGSVFFDSNDTIYFADGTSSVISSASGTFAASTVEPTASTAFSGQFSGSATVSQSTAPSSTGTRPSAKASEAESPTATKAAAKGTPKASATSTKNEGERTVPGMSVAVSAIMIFLENFFLL